MISYIQSNFIRLAIKNRAFDLNALVKQGDLTVSAHYKGVVRWPTERTRIWKNKTNLTAASKIGTEKYGYRKDDITTY